jgi:hypothetical protein
VVSQLTGHLRSIFQESYLEIEWIQKKIDELANTDEVLVTDAIAELKKCLADRPTSPC